MTRVRKYVDLKLISIIIIVQFTLNLYDIFQRSFITKKGVLKLDYSIQGTDIYGKLAEFIGVIICMVLVSIFVNYFIQSFLYAPAYDVCCLPVC